MSVPPAVARHVRDLIDRQRLDALADHDLLTQYRETRDDRAFAALVRRHGPLVLGTCRRILNRAHDAEDACQATFLVLARKAGTVRGGAALAGWLHRVAVRAAGRLRRDLARRPTEPLPPDVVNPVPVAGGLEWREIRGAFDAEVGRLPDRFRLPLVLCYLEGKTRAEAAVALGWSEGAVRGRLERGRKLLQSRFVRRGITLPAALVAMIAWESGVAVAESVPTSTAARLAEAVLRSMVIAKAKLVGWATAAVLLIGTAVGVGTYHPLTAGQQPGTPPPPAKADPPPAVADAEKNLDTFTLRVTLAPAGENKFDPKYDLCSVFLYVPNLRLEPPANGPSGKPREAHARITKGQAKTVTAALKEQGFFTDVRLESEVVLKIDRTKPHAALVVRHQNGEDAAIRDRVYPWAAGMLKPLDAVRACVDGDAADALDRLLGQLAEDRQNWVPGAEDLKRLQGTWTTDFGRADGGAARPLYAKCVIDGNRLVFKPRIQTDPLLDLDTIRGTFKLAQPPTDGRRVLPRALAVTGTRDTVAKTEAGEWRILYEVRDELLTLMLTPRGSDWPPGLTERDEKDYKFVLRRVPEKPPSSWGEAADGVRTRITAAKTRFAAAERVELVLDVKAEAGKRSWAAGRAAILARVEVNGVWYAPQYDPRYYIPKSDLPAGTQTDRWAVVALGADWVTEATRGQKVPRALDLKPGKYTVRMKYTFWAGDGAAVSVSPVSGPLEIEVAAPAAGAAPPPADWGEPSEGVRLRARVVKPRLAADEFPTFDLDVKADAAGPAVWYAPHLGVYARVEIDGVGYHFPADRLKKVARYELKTGGQGDGWVSVALSDDLRPETKQVPDGWKFRLAPGKHTVRLGFDFTSDRPEGKTAKPMSGPVEIEMGPPPVGDAGWRKAWSAAKSWQPGRDNDIRFSPDGKTLGLTTGQELRLLDVSGPAPKEIAKHTVEGHGRLAGWTATAEPRVVHFLPRRPVSNPVFDVYVGGVSAPAAGTSPVVTLDDFPRVVALSPDGSRLALVGYGWDPVRVFDVKTRAERRMKAPAFAERTWHARPQGAVFSPDSRTLVGFGGNDYPVRGWNNGSAVAWDAATGAVQWEAESEGPIKSWAFSTDGRRLATGAFPTGDALVLDARTGKSLVTHKSSVIGDVALGADGQTLVVAGREAGPKPKPGLTFRPVTGDAAVVQIPTVGFVRRIAFRPDGKAFVTADENGEVALWVRDIP